MFGQKRSKFVREGVPKGEDPFVPGTPDNVKIALIRYWDAHNRAVDINNEYHTPNVVVPVAEPKE